MDITPEQLEQALAIVRAAGKHTLLDRFVSPDCYETLDEGVRRFRLMAADVETTGLLADDHKIIELGFTIAEFTSDGRLGRILQRFTGFEDPGHPLADETIRLTGITDADVAGQRLDDAVVEEAIRSVDLVIAHNANLDRKFLEKRFPAFADKYWACSYQEGPWEAFEVGSQKLDYLAYKVAGVDFDGHRALNDAEITLHLLSLRTPDGYTVLKHLLDSARKPSYHVWAVDSPFDAKDILKDERKYRWSPEASKDGSMLKAWHKELLFEDAYREEIAALQAIYPRPTSQVVVDVHTGRTRYSTRLQSRNRVEVGKMASLLPPPKAPASGPSMG